MKITTLNPEVDGSVDPAYSYDVYEGHLTEEQLRLAASKELTSSDDDDGGGGYEGYAIAKIDDGQWLITFARHAPFTTEPYGVSGERVAFDEQGDLVFYAVHCETIPAPTDER